MLTKLSDLFAKHESLVITLVLVALASFIASKTLGYLKNRDDQNAAQAHAQLLQQQRTDTQLAAVTATEQQRYDALVQRLDAANRKLSTNQVQRDTQTEHQQAVDRTLPPDQLAQRWATLVKQPDTITPANGGYQVEPAAAIETVTQLEAVPQLRANLTDEKSIVTNKDSQIGELTTLKVDQGAQLAGLISEMALQDKACKADIAAVKAAARKSKLRWFGIGVIVGAVARSLVVL